MKRAGETHDIHTILARSRKSRVCGFGFDIASIIVPTAIYYDPDDTVLSRQHGEWLARTMPHATLSTTAALGHRSETGARD
jgi:pimeloyl-ACP methyl ester carboxylesterase